MKLAFYITCLIGFIVWIVTLGAVGPFKEEKIIYWKMKYYILTVQEEGGAITNHSPRTVVYEGNLVSYLLIERELGRKTNIIFKEEISLSEYTLYHTASQRYNK